MGQCQLIGTPETRWEDCARLGSIGPRFSPWAENVSRSTSQTPARSASEHGNPPRTSSLALRVGVNGGNYRARRSRASGRGTGGSWPRSAGRPGPGRTRGTSRTSTRPTCWRSACLRHRPSGRLNAAANGLVNVKLGDPRRRRRAGKQQLGEPLDHQRQREQQRSPPGRRSSCSPTSCGRSPSRTSPAWWSSGSLTAMIAR